MHPDYPAWLLRAVPSEATARTKLSELRRVESVYGDVDDAFDRDELQGLIEELTYTSEDARRGRENPSRLEINGDLRNNLASYKSAVMKYARFRQDVELESARGLAASVETQDLRREPGEDGRTFSLERDLQAALRSDLGQLEPGLVVADGGVEKTVASGRIDILATGASGVPVVVELKAVRAPRDAVAQILAYMGDISAETARDDVRGLLVAPDFDPRAISAARMVPSLRLVSYVFRFAFQPVDTLP